MTRSNQSLVVLLVVALLTGGVALYVRAQGQSGDRPAAPDFSVNTLDGKQVKLGDLRGKVVVLDFWATWCPPCRKSLPHLQKLSQDKDLAAKGVTVIAMNVDEEKQTVEKFMKDNGYTFTVGMDAGGAVAKKFKVEGIPSTFIIDAGGKVTAGIVGYGGESTDKEIKDAIAKALAAKDK